MGHVFFLDVHNCIQDPVGLDLQEYPICTADLINGYRSSPACSIEASPISGQRYKYKEQC